MATHAAAAASKRHVLDRYRHLRDDHLRYMEKWGLVRSSRDPHGHTVYSFADLALLRQVDTEMADGSPFRGVLRALVASRAGQLAFDFRLEAPLAKVLRLTTPQPPPMTALMGAVEQSANASAEQYFHAASVLDDGSPEHVVDAMNAYRRALEVDPYLVPALINLANLHYSRDDAVEAQALYERAIALEPHVFEAHFNLGNIFHDLGRFSEAQGCYREALRLNPTYPEAHFYLAVTLEKGGRSHDARAHWRAYQQLAPNGEWVHLAKEFSD
ncbi:MAG TPA: tetratricopeptide repeat protein [Vicinamibacterales bacterium]